MSTLVVIPLMLLALWPDRSLVSLASSAQPAALPVPFAVVPLSSSPLPPQSELGKGKFLVASRQLGDPNFAETVVLLLEANQEEGAIGVIINRPTDVRLSTLLPDLKGLQQRTDLVYLGGPVAGNQLLLLTRSNSQPEGSHPVFKDVYTISGRPGLQRMLDEAGAGARFRAYVGYAGWAPGQLGLEVLRGDWRVLQADAETIFGKASSEIWPELIRRSEAQWTRAQKRDQWNLFAISRDTSLLGRCNLPASCAALLARGFRQQTEEKEGSLWPQPRLTLSLTIGASAPSSPSLSVSCGLSCCWASAL